MADLIMQSGSLNRCVGNRWRSLWARVALSLPLWLAFGVATADSPAPGTAASDPAPITILYPPSSSIILTDSLQLVVAVKTFNPMPRIALNNEPVEASRMSFAESWPVYGAILANAAGKKIARPIRLQSPLLQNKSNTMLLTATLAMKPGRNVIEVGDLTARIFRSTPQTVSHQPEDWKTYRTHPNPADAHQPMACPSCHEVKTSNETTTLGRVAVPGACRACHKDPDLRRIHTHIMDLMSNCVICHDPHGSRRPHLLISTKTKLCEQCHDPEKLK